MSCENLKVINKSFGKQQVAIYFFEDATIINGNTYIWGFPYNNLDLLLKDSWTNSNLNKVAGYYVAIRVEEDRIEIVNDILGGYRLYYGAFENVIFISNDYEFLLSKAKDYSKISINKDQLKYWEKHRYTLNEGTLFQEIKKLSPAAKYIIDKDGIRYSSYFCNVSRRSSYNRLIRKNYSEIKNSIKTVYDQNPDIPYILFYSGGVDSTLLLFICREIGIPINCIVIKYLPEWSVNVADIERAKQNLQKLGQQYTVIEVNLYEAKKNFAALAVKEMLFDRHLAVHFYQTYKVVAEVFGNNIVVINGQSADSILSFGPSELTTGNKVKRAILAFSKGPIGLIGKMVCCIAKTRYIMPCGKKDSSISIMDDSDYVFAIDRKCDYFSMLENEYKRILTQKITSYESVRMYSKIIGFLQGSDNQIVIKAALDNGIKKVVMPFTSPEFIYNVVRYKNNCYEIFNPKYFVRQLLQKKYTYSGITKKNVVLKNDFDMTSFEKSMTNNYTSKVKSILDA